MDWRAKSVSRSRSRAPGDMSMDWRAQSRSRSRAPDFRVRPPSLSRPEASSATAQVSRFHGDTGGAVASPTEDHSLQSLASSLGLLSPNAVGGAAGFDGSTLDYSTASSSTFAFPPDAQSPQDPTTNPNLAEIENTLNQLITLQSLSASVPHPVPPWPINTSSALSPSTDSLAHSPRPALAFASPSYAASPYADAVALHNLEQASVGSPHTDYGFLQKLSMGSYDRGVSSPGALQQLVSLPFFDRSVAGTDEIGICSSRILPASALRSPAKSRRVRTSTLQTSLKRLALSRSPPPAPRDSVSLDPLKSSRRPATLCLQARATPQLRLTPTHPLPRSTKASSTPRRPTLSLLPSLTPSSSTTSTHTAPPRATPLPTSPPAASSSTTRRCTSTPRSSSTTSTLCRRTNPTRRRGVRVLGAGTTRRRTGRPRRQVSRGTSSRRSSSRSRPP